MDPQPEVRRLLAVRLTPLLMAADWPSNEVWQAPGDSRGLTAAAGSAAQVAFGIALLAARGVLGPRWPPFVQEAIFLSAPTDVGAIGNPLPVPQSVQKLAAERVNALSGAAREAVLVAASLSRPTADGRRGRDRAAR